MMPQDMQKNPQPDEQIVEENLYANDTHTPDSVLDVESLSPDDPLYATALDLLKHGHTPKQIAQKLVDKGVIQARPKANRLALRVAKENPQEQRTNAYVLFAVAGIIGGVGAVFIGLRWLAGDFSLSSVYVSLLISAWFAYKGYESYSNTVKKN